MPVTVESAHADAFEWLPPMSAMTFCWRNVETAENKNNNNNDKGEQLRKGDTLAVISKYEWYL